MLHPRWNRDTAQLETVAEGKTFHIHERRRQINLLQIFTPRKSILSNLVQSARSLKPHGLEISTVLERISRNLSGTGRNNQYGVTHLKLCRHPGNTHTISNASSTLILIIQSLNTKDVNQ